ncbi:hypothetical protein [Streptomyces echinatus]|uniref:Uncharacterized protein n=1 Tax=Streptomyces echinatus TaxID=67293 RepID=A0A7W9PSZ7_9ACTN|nr:hypothetical protein [Streptomyces echinatus]MBB5926727.1 hypothetical protein [Streptomyces echinatus]
MYSGTENLATAELPGRQAGCDRQAESVAGWNDGQWSWHLNHRGADMEIKPQAAVIPDDTRQLEQGKYGPIFPKTPACYGFTIVADVKPGRADAIRGYGQALVEKLEQDPELLEPLKLHYLRWVLFDDDKRFMYQGIFDTDFDKYTEDAVMLFTKAGVNTVFENLEGFPEDWKTNPDAFVRFVRAHHCPSFLEYGEYPYVTGDEIKKALRVKSALSEMLDQMQ